MKLNNRRTILVGLAFLSICTFWQMYDSVMTLILTDTFKLNETFAGAIMAADNVLALFLLPFFGALSDKTSTRIGRRMPFIVGGTALAAILMNLIPLLDDRYAANPSTGTLVLFIIVLGLLLVSMGTYRSPAVALMPDVTPKPLRSRANAIINLMGAVGGILYLGLAALNIGTVLPLGISYYIFKIISYEVDVCTGKIAPEKNFITFAVYVLFFPQLIVGPIVKYREMADQLHDGANRCTPARAEHGAELFVFGLAKKVILADSIGALWTDIIGAGGVGLTNVSTPLAWLGIIAYSLQLYFDFAGYSEMSNGLAALLGFDCPANFNLPYISGSITEFWRRWHITLSGWFRDYIYIPLGGNRKGQARQLLNMFLVWAATGIWHGASWNFIAWGLYYFVLLTIEKNFLLKYLKKGKVWPHIYTLFFVVLGWGIFTANQPGAPLGLLLQKLFLPQGGISPVYYLRNYGVLLVLGCVCSSALPHWLWEKISKNTVAKLLVFALLTALCVCYVVAATNATALYANF